jgi:glycerol-3-phosphate dehydrogenase (NAD(P)+)
MSETNLTVLGAGSWGTALAKLVADRGTPTRLWARSSHLAESIESTRVNASYLPGFELPKSLRATSDLEDALTGATCVLVVVPTHGLRDVLMSALPFLPEGSTIVSATKGIEENSLLLVSEIFEQILPPAEHSRLTYLGGPSFAKEVAANMPTAVSIAGHDKHHRDIARDVFSTDRFRAYTTEDVIGVEVGGALKNVIAIAVGVADGMGFGHNSRAGLITRGLAEINRVAVTLGANPLTIAGLSGMGDLVLTCTGELSRNRTVGVKLGQGQKLADILGSMNMVAEGVRTAHSANQLSQKLGLDMPITHEVYRMLYEDKLPHEVLASLMARPLRPERE